MAQSKLTQNSARAPAPPIAARTSTKGTLVHSSLSSKRSMAKPLTTAVTLKAKTPVQRKTNGAPTGVQRALTVASKKSRVANPKKRQLTTELADAQNTSVESPKSVVARTMATSSTLHAIYGMEPWITQSMGEVDLCVLMDTLVQQGDAMKRGDLGKIELMLFNQAMTLQAMFTALSRRASMNIGEHMNAVDTYLRLALKTQSQCRTTLEALAEIKNPRPATFVKQANIANGPQQVNNGSGDPALAHGKSETTIQPNELLEAPKHGKWMDTGTTGKSIAGDSSLATVATVDGAADS